MQLSKHFSKPSVYIKTLKRRANETKKKVSHYIILKHNYTPNQPIHIPFT